MADGGTRIPQGDDEGFTSGPNTPAWPGAIIVAALLVAGLVWWLT